MGSIEMKQQADKAKVRQINKGSNTQKNKIWNHMKVWL